VDGGDDTSEGARDPERFREKPRGACREPKLHTTATRSLVQHSPRSGSVDFDVVVFEQENTQSLAEARSHRPRPAGLERLSSSPEGSLWSVLTKSQTSSLLETINHST